MAKSLSRQNLNIFVKGAWLYYRILLGLYIDEREGRRNPVLGVGPRERTWREPGETRRKRNPEIPTLSLAQ